MIVGLGNPGAQYERTRHNAGFMVLDRLAQRHAAGAAPRLRFHGVTLDARIGDEQCMLLKPLTYMNRSGLSVGEALRFYKLSAGEDLVVVVDDVALPVGSIRVRPGGSDGGHNGLADIDRALGGVDYPRIRVGVGEVPKFMVRADWVLSKFMKEETEAVEAGIAAATEAVETAVSSGLNTAMNKFNRKVGSDKDESKEEQ